MVFLFATKILISAVVPMSKSPTIDNSKVHDTGVDIPNEISTSSVSWNVSDVTLQYDSCNLNEYHNVLSSFPDSFIITETKLGLVINQGIICTQKNNGFQCPVIDESFNSLLGTTTFIVKNSTSIVSKENNSYEFNTDIEILTCEGIPCSGILSFFTFPCTVVLSANIYSNEN